MTLNAVQVRALSSLITLYLCTHAATFDRPRRAILPSACCSYAKIILSSINHLTKGVEFPHSSSLIDQLIMMRHDKEGMACSLLTAVSHPCLCNDLCRYNIPEGTRFSQSSLVADQFVAHILRRGGDRKQSRGGADVFGADKTWKRGAYIT